jgi:hypothetical protein
VGRLNALRAAARELGGEAAAARDAAAMAAQAVRALVDSIVFGEADALAAEAIAAIELHWRIIDRLRGLVMIDEGRHGGPRLRGFQERLLESIDRRKAEVIRDPLLVEEWRWRQHLAELGDAQKAAWLDYARRLANDPSATFGEGMAQ